MRRRQVLAYATWSPLVALAAAVSAQGSPSDAETALRRAFTGYVASWNAHDLAAWAAWLTEDVEWVDPSNPVPKQSKAVVTTFAAYNVRAYEIDLRIKKLVLAPDGKHATVLLEGKWLELPKKDGVYAREWPRDLLLSRWRLDGDQWRLAYMNNHAGSSAEAARKEGLN